MSNDTTHAYFSTATDAEQAFYSAFEACDLELMKSVWADSAVSCVHPGAPLLQGRDAVLSSWKQIMHRASPPVVNIETISRVSQDQLAIHTVIERIAADHKIDSPTAEVIATNILIKQANGWRMLQHHASVVMPEVLEAEMESPHKAPRVLQ